MSVTRRTVDQVFERLAAFDRRLWAGIFFGVVGLYTLALLIEAMSYSSDARLFPLIVGVPFLGLIVAKIALILLQDRLRIGSTELFDFDEEFSRVTEDEVSPGVRYRREFVMILWLVGLSGLLWAFGFLPALLVFIFTFVELHERNPVRAAAIAGGTFGFVYLFFIRLLDATIYQGVYPIGIPGISL